MKVTLSMLLMAMILVGCESSPVRRAEYLAKHPEWDAQTVKLVKEGFIVQGMTLDQVRAAWGRPCYSCTGTTMDSDWDKWVSWEYQTQIVFFDKNERVERWTQK